MELSSRLLIKNLTGNTQEDVSIEITDLSKTGVGSNIKPIMDTNITANSSHKFLFLFLFIESITVFLEFLHLVSFVTY